MGRFLGMTAVDLAAVYKKEAHHYHWYHRESESMGVASDVVGWSYNDPEMSSIQFTLKNGRVTEVAFDATGEYGEAVEVSLNNSFRCLGIRRWVDTASKTYWKMSYGLDLDHRYRVVVRK
ncbi:hypothetical protein D0N36_00965 [Hymenobacter lapidiphilus]|nr:hypothetical protein D0N36_00965 [Hymenobacter sp. CCM 8763]